MLLRKISIFSSLSLLLLSSFLLVQPSESIKFNLKCHACHAAVEGFKFAYERNVTSDKIIDFAIFICKTFTHHEPLVCQGMTSQFRAQFLYVVEKLIFAPEQLCGMLMNDCGTPHNPFNSNWSIPLTPKPEISPYLNRESKSPGLTTRQGKPTFRVLQLSDLHFDIFYQPGAEAICLDPICCQADSTNMHQKNPKTRNHIIKPAGYWGTIGKCDIPYWTIENMLKHINQTEKNIDYIMLSGDYMSHKDWSYTRQDHLNIIKNLTDLIEKYFPETPTFWTIGNHEGVPVNTFGPHFVPKQFRPQWLYSAVYNSGKKWLNAKNAKEMIYRASYAIKLSPKLKLITVNTGYCETTNFFLYLNQVDPDTTLAWLAKELQKAESNGEYVHILAHIPPGDGECLQGWARNYYRIVQRFSETIRGQFFGHTHWDSFALFYEDMNDPFSKAINVLYTAPSVTTFEDLNPAYRIYTVEGDVEGSKHDILEYETHFFNLSKAEEGHEPNWELLYNAKDEYNMPNLSPESWQKVSEKLRTNLPFYEKFLKNYARRDDYRCDLECRHELLCSMRASHHNRTALCADVKIAGDPLSSFIKYRTTTQQSVIEKVKSTLWGHLSSWATETING
jgi:sphingomyelin phosphodiesterase